MKPTLAAAFLLFTLSAWGEELWVSNERDGTVQVIDTKTDRVIATTRTANRPRGMVLGPDGRRVYVAVSWWRDGKRPRTGKEAIVAIDAKSRKVAREYTAGGTDPECVAIGPDGQHLYLSNEDAGTASVVDVKSGKHLATLIVGTEPEGVAASPDGRWVYVTAETSNVVTVIDAKKRKVAANILVDSRPRVVLFSKDSRRAWITAELGGTVLLVDVSKHRVVKRVKLRANDKPVGLALSPDERRLYVANGRGNAVTVIDTATLKVLAVIPTGGERVWGIAITGDGKKVYAANSLSNTIAVIDTATNRVVRHIKVGDGPWALLTAP